MNQKIEVIHLGLIDYTRARAVQENLHNHIAQIKKNRVLGKEFHKETPNYLIFCEHFPVYTLGSSGTMEQFLVEHSASNSMIPLCKTNRGGGITYHGPGQLIIYPILDLENFFTDIHRYLRLLEDAIMVVLRYFHIEGARIAGLTGVWLLGNAAKSKKTVVQKKICSIGIKVSKWITMHGLALNVNNSLKPFKQILPCGLSNELTSMKAEIDQSLSMISVMKTMERVLIEKLQTRSMA